MLNGHTAVAVNASGQLVAADATNPAHLGAIPGIVVNAYGPGASAPVRNDTIVHHAGWSWANGPVLVGTNGALVQTLPGGAVFSQVIGFAVAPTIVRVDVQIPISLI